MEEELLNISEAAEFLGVSLDTLRRWDKSGKLLATRKEGGTHRHYKKSDLVVFSSDMLKLVREWVTDGLKTPPLDFYCPNSAVFTTRLVEMENLLMRNKNTKLIFSLLTAIAGEIGNNSYDHNLGNWPDTPGVFFSYDIHEGRIVLADRGLGILGTLGRVRPELKNHQDALLVAFTEIVSGRAPEERGNGLKFVRKVIQENSINLTFQSGDAELKVIGKSVELPIKKVATNIRGCFALIEF